MGKRLTKKKWRRRKQIQRLLRVSFLAILTFAVFFVAVSLGNEWILRENNILNQYEDSEFVLDGVTLGNNKTVEAQLLTTNPYSRPGTKMKNINGIVIHYVGNPETTAENNRNYFEGLAKKQSTYASSHFVVGLKGEIIQCVPVNEVAYCSNDRNEDTISIEVCHPDTTGKFEPDTYESVVELTAYLCKLFELTPDDVIRHFDVSGKRCPLYYVDHEDAWIQLKNDVKDALEDLK